MDVTPSQTPSPAAPRARWRGLIAPGLLALAALAILVSLGNWQMRRLAWKEGLIAQWEARAGAPAQEAPAPQDWAALSAQDYEFRRVRLRGAFDHAREALVFHGAGGPAREPGYLVVTPLRLASGAHVLVNRGFAPQALADPARRAQGQVAGETEVVGLMRAPEARNAFTPADEPARRVWHVRDPLAMAQALGLEGAAPFLIDAEGSPAPGGWPLPTPANVRNVPNKHLSYALTWYGLALTLVGVFAVFCWRRLRGTD
jgi:surfeit locus 1 family protein